MQKNISNIPDFFPNWNFNSTSFYLFLPSIKEQEKKELTTLILKYNGKITFTITKETIIVIENLNFFKYKENKELIKDFNIIHCYDNNFIRKIYIKNNRSKNFKEENIIKIITLNSLYDEINMFKSKLYDFFIEKGLNKNYSSDTTICIYLRNKHKKESDLIFQNFNNSKKLEENNIPFYHPKAPDTFSLFCSEYEFKQILRHIKTEEYQIQLKEKKNKLEEEKILKEEPEPNKKEFLCQICKARFDKYLEHIKSNLHNKNKIKYSEAFISINNTFKRIVENNKINNKKNKNKNELIIEENNLLVSTKEDSLPINEENNKIIYEKKNLEKIDEKVEENYKTQSEKSDIEINVDDILKILETIENKEIKGEQKMNKKRKKGDKINIWNNDYVKNIQKVTGKIYYYNGLISEIE